jgi:hypothetical protein
MADTGDDVRDRLHVDVRSVRPNAPGHGGPARDLGLVGDHYRLIDEFGMGWQMPRTGGYYYDLYLSPLADCRTAQDIERYAWPEALDPARYGAIWEFIPLLIEAGVDILNPWQVNCKGMDDTKRFKREFGADLTIWGGSCDTQSVLPFGTPQQVRDETRRRIEDLAPGGGYVFAPIHVIQAGVPPENIIAWRETLMEYGLYDET